MTAKSKDDGTRIMNDHGVYPLLDTLANDALLQIVCGDDTTEEPANLYADAKGFHLVWRTVKKDKNGDAVWNGGKLLLDTRSADVTADFAAKLDYDGKAPGFNNTAKAKANDNEANNDETWFITAPEMDDAYTFTICGLKDGNGTHLSHVFASDGKHSRLLLAAGSKSNLEALEHTVAAMIIDCLSNDDITTIDTDADILSMAKELLK